MQNSEIERQEIHPGAEPDGYHWKAYERLRLSHAQNVTAFRLALLFWTKPNWIEPAEQRTRKSLLTRKSDDCSFLVNYMGSMTSTAQISDLHTHLGYWLRVVSNAVSHSFARRVEAEGVTVAEWVFLRVLFNSEHIAPSLLAKRMGMTKSAISKLADRLVVKGLVKRELDPNDKRGQRLALKAKGRKLVPRLAAIADDNDFIFFHSLTQSERQQLKRLLRKIASERELTDVPTD